MNELQTEQHVQRGRAMRSRWFRFMPLVCLTIGLCSCTATHPRMSRNPVEESPNSKYADQQNAAVAEWIAKVESESPQLNSGLQAASYSEPATIRVNDAARIPAANSGTNTPAQFTPAEPRVPTANGAVQLAAHQQAQGGAGELAMQYPDEYLFDGGDRALPIRYDAFRRLGLDTEDTVAEYSDHKGKRHVKASNRVAVYAPRFGAVRTVSNPITGVAVNKLSGAQLTTQGVGLLARTGTAMNVKGDQADAVRVRSRASGLNSRTTRVSLNQRTSLKIHDKLLNIFQNLSFIKTGRVNTTEEARIAARIQAATAWTRDRFPVIVGSLNTANEVETTHASKTVTGIDDSHKRDGRLRIVKLADKQSASPGDVITFTIRFDNLGDQPVKNIRIVDNLTTRLEYVDDSATSSRGGRLDVEDNEEGSLVLKFVLDKPLPGGEGGFVTFKAKVR